MSRYPPPDYRGPRERSRSPPRFPDRRPSAAASIFDSRAPGPPRNVSEAPRGPRVQHNDGPRPPFSGGGSVAGVGPRPGFNSLRDAPPLGSGDRVRPPFRERDYDRRDRVPSPRERSPIRTFKDQRDLPPRDLPPRDLPPRDLPTRDLDIDRARRASRDGPISAGSNFSDHPPFSAPVRGGFARGRGRGDFAPRGGRGGRRDFDDRDLFRRDRSPPVAPPAPTLPAQRWQREVPRDGREPERRDDRRTNERRDDDRRPDWPDRERDADRTARRDQPPPRLEPRPSHDMLVASAPAPPAAPPGPTIDPGRLALLEKAGADLTVRRLSAAHVMQPPREVRRDMPETPSYLNGRAETMANRYNQRGSSPPTHAPAVPAFSFTPSAPQTSAASTHQMSVPAGPHSSQSVSAPIREPTTDPVRPSMSERYEPPINAPTAPKAPPLVPKVELAEPPPSAPKAPRAQEVDALRGAGARLHGVRSLETLNLAGQPDGFHGSQRANPFSRAFPTGLVPLAPTHHAQATQQKFVQPTSPNAQTTRFGELAAPTGPRATRISPAQTSVSPRPPFASPRPDIGGFPGLPGFLAGQTPPPSAPSGPRNRSFSVSPKIATSSAVPTAPKGIRVPPVAPRANDRPMAVQSRAPDGVGAAAAVPPPWAPPSAPRSLQWNQWRRPGAPAHVDKTVPAKRDFAGDEKEYQPDTLGRRGMAEPDAQAPSSAGYLNATAQQVATQNATVALRNVHNEDRMDLDTSDEQPQPAQASAHSAAQSFFGKPQQSTEEDHPMSDAPEEQQTSSDDEEVDIEQDLALFNAKFERHKRSLESQLADLSAREYRATTPLESIARLNRIEPNDLYRLQEHQEMEIDEPPTVEAGLLVPPATHSSGSDDGPEIVTPAGEEATAVGIRDDNDSNEGKMDDVRRTRRLSPEIINLPYLVKNAEPFVETEDFQTNIRHQQDTKAVVSAALREETEEENMADAEGHSNFRSLFQQWREECELLDREQEELEKLERHQSIEPGPEVDDPATLPNNPVMEGRRLMKFSSQYEIDLIIEQSKETARLEQERKDLESQKAKADILKEAIIPDQQLQTHFQRSVFIDANRLRDPAKLTLAFSYEPQPDTFSEEEQRIFVASFRETPKKWGEIASLLPGKSYKDCIHHYYANKWDGRFRDSRTRKLKASGRRGRGGKAPPRGRGAALMADLGRTEEVVSVPNVSDSGRPKRAAAPTTFGERESDAKAAMLGPSPAKKPGLGVRQDTNGDAVTEKPAKRRRGPGGEKPGRKPKAQQPLAALAAAPAASPSIAPLQSIPNLEDVARAQSLEDANLLAGLQSGHHNMPQGDDQLIYHQHQQEIFGPPMLREDDIARSKMVGQTPSSKSSASSYWSVPEQTDFAKYIAHFGTDFAAIAAHMGTKTQTMIKNHYTRQIDSGNRPELHVHAVEADKRRNAGEDMGPPPTPTPIVKRKYDNPTQPTAPRPLAPNTESMEVDEPTIPQRASLQSKHVSPPQVQAQPRFTPSAQATPIPAHRIVQSPVPSAASPAMSQAQPTPLARPMQHPLGQRLAFLSDTRPESRPGIPATSSFRLGQETPPRSQPQQNTANPVSDHYLRDLFLEQDRALRMQQQQGQQEHGDQVHRQPSMSSVHRGSAQGSPALLPLQPPLERKPFLEERAITPPRNSFVQSPFSRPPFTHTPFGPLAAPLPASLTGRAAFNTSLPKKEEHRSGSVGPAAPIIAPALPSEAPKRSNLMSILNNPDAEEPRPPKRESLPTGPVRVVTPAPTGFSSAATPAPQSNVPSARRETFGQPTMPQSQFHRTSFGPQDKSTAPAVPPQAVKREPSAVGPPSASESRADWTTRVLAKPTQPSQSSQPTLERDSRSYFPHRASALGALGQQGRANPSPPPHKVTGHSRAPSLTTQPHQPPLREQHPVVPGQHPQNGHRGPVQPLHANPYAQQSAGPPFSQAPPQQVQSHTHHSHNNSLGGGFPNMHHRAPSRDDHMRQQQLEQETAVRRRDEEMRWRQETEMRERIPDRQVHESEVQELERQHAEQQFYLHQRQQQQQQQQSQERFNQQQGFAHGPPPPQQALHQPGYNGAPFGQPRPGVGLRDQSLRESEDAMQVEQHRRMQHQQQQYQLQQQQQRQYGDDRLHHDVNVRDQERQEMEHRRRQQDAMFSRRTPLGNGFGHPPPQPPRR